MLDGKRVAADTMVVALGITLRGEKVLLGFVQTGTENAEVCATFLRNLRDRGLRIDEGLLVVLDGGKGLRRAVREVVGNQALVQRCTWHKRENVVTYLPKHLQPAWRAKLQQACRQPTYAAAHASLQRLHGDLRRLNEDAARSLAEGLEETLTLHRLGLAERLGMSLNTTNGLESILALVEQRVGKVDRWTTSDQKQRWLATTLLELEPRLRRLRGYRALPALRVTLKENLTQAKEVMVANDCWGCSLKFQLPSGHPRQESLDKESADKGSADGGRVESHWLLYESTSPKGEAHMAHRAIAWLLVGGLLCGLAVGSTGPAAAQTVITLTIHFQTGGDDLRGGNDNVNVVILVRSGPPLRHNNVNESQRWPDNSIRTVTLRLTTVPRIEDLLGIRVETTVSGGAGGDNWNLDRLIVKARIGGSERVLWDQRGTPLVRFTGERRLEEFRFLGGAAPLVPAVRTAFRPAVHGWKFVNDFKNIIGVFNITTTGLCGGMVYAALDHYYAGMRIPQQTHMPAEGTGLQSYLYGRQVNSLERNLDRWAELGFNPGGARNREIFTWGLQMGSGRLGQLIEWIDGGRPVPLALQGCGGDCRCLQGGNTVDCPGNHQVLAIGYELGRYRGNPGERTEDLSIFIYDPNHPNQTLTMKPDQSGAWYYYRERPNNKDYRWRAYFVDTNYTRVTPSAVPESENEIIVEFHTGADDLRGGRDNADMVLNFRGRAPLRFRNINNSRRWINESRQTISRSLSRVEVGNLIGIRLETYFGGGVAGDNWNLDWVAVWTRQDGRLCTLLRRGRPLGQEGTPLFRFTGDRRVLDLPFSAAERSCP